jgi:hypothetical protein
LYLDNGHTLETIQKYWLEELELPVTALRAHSVRATKSSYTGTRHPYGVASLYLAQSGAVLNSIYGAIQEFSGSENPIWQS